MEKEQNVFRKNRWNAFYLRRKNSVWRMPLRIAGQEYTIASTNTDEYGAVSLVMVMAYYGERMSLEQLRLDCSVLRDGSKTKIYI